MTFPHRHALCESCGYPLVGVTARGQCPECGEAVAASSPAQRTGPAWQAHPSIRNWFAMARDLMLQPRRTFRHMDVGGSNLPPRVFLLVVVGVIVAGWWLIEWLVRGQPGVLAWAYAMAAGKTVVVLTYVEALGVTFFSARRGWRVPFRLAERVACYAALGWLPAAAVFAKVYLLMIDGVLEQWWIRNVGMWTGDRALLILGLVGALALMGFEILVWTGVRQVRYANAPAG